VKIALHPFMYAYMVHGLPSLRMKWVFKHKRWIRLQPMPSYHFLEYRFFNKVDDEIKI
jgi:ribonuclease G